MNYRVMKAKMIARRVSKGHREDESVELLREIVGAHSGDNLASALVYNEFATEKQAYRFVEEMN